MSPSVLDNPVIKEIEADASLTPFQRKLKMLPFVRQAKDELSEIYKKRASLNEQITEATLLHDELKAFEESGWTERTEYALEKNDCSRFHKLIQALKFGRMHRTDGEDAEPIPHVEKLYATMVPFVVDHDWSGAFKNATDFDEGEIRLPYQLSAFEFRVSGRNVIVTVTQTDETGTIAILFVQIGENWLTRGLADRDSIVGKMVWMQIRAICIALDADVAIHNIIRAPSHLNSKRERQGKTPLFSYAVVTLNGAHRMNRHPYSGCGTHRSPRLHFRRGHWRHYLEHKTWIRWTLVGNPDLGFVDKEYRL